jgi:basic membrane protein A and related proteins
LRLSGENLRLGLLLVLLAALLAACGGGDDEDSAGAEQPERTIRVALSTDLGQLNDRGFNQLAYEGLKRAERELGIEIRVAQARSAADYVPNFTSLARDGYDLLIGVGFAQGDAVADAAKRFPESRFAIVDVDQSALKGKPQNVVGLLFREEQAGYLAGVLAATSVKSGTPPTIGSVGGFKEPPVDRFIAGYQAGAEWAQPGIRTLNAYSSDWDDQAKCKEIALNQIARGATVIFQVAGGCGLGALDAARERRVWGIGVDADQSFLGRHVLTSALKRVDEAVFRTIKSVVDGEWQGGRNLVFGLEQDGVGLGKISGQVPPEDRMTVEEAERRILAGEVEIPRSL